mmetsp:Transcript_71688/g.232042  ORF Transcript_71688/g.232042 Transcript_71688/m.232042 type:complete len:109 (-) Transcript_71688:38-364(-)
MRTRSPRIVGVPSPLRVPDIGEEGGDLMSLESYLGDPKSNLAEQASASTCCRLSIDWRHWSRDVACFKQCCPPGQEERCVVFNIFAAASSLLPMLALQELRTVFRVRC